MKHVIIGTAGHVDHGKTLLIKALTGDVNALEEKLRLGLRPIIGRIHNDAYLLDVRTLWEADFSVIVSAIREALA